MYVWEPLNSTLFLDTAQGAMQKTKSKLESFIRTDKVLLRGDILIVTNSVCMYSHTVPGLLFKCTWEFNMDKKCTM